MQYNKDYTSRSNYDPCASDNSMSEYYENNLNELNKDVINYTYVRKNIQKLNKGTIYLLKLVEKKGFNDDNFLKLANESDVYKFLKTYGSYLPEICEQLYDANISCLIYSLREDNIILYKFTIDNADKQYISFYYDTIESKNERFLIDANEMAKSGFYLYSFSEVKLYDLKDVKTCKGFMATFEKKL